MDVFLHGQPVAFPPSAFVAAGGEATVYALGDRAYKVFHAPTDGTRLQALAALSVPGALLPEDLLTDGGGQVVGHTMALVPDAVPLARLLSRSFCTTHGFDLAARLRIARGLADLVHTVHAQDALVVDLHEGNVLLDADGAPLLCDTSSWQLPGFPATALQDAVRDRHATGFDEGTDWFAFAVTAAQLLLGVHPYRGTHPHLKTLDARMVARVSVFDGSVRLPPVCPSPAVVPASWRDWLTQVLDGTHRGPPPRGEVLPTWHTTPTPLGTRVDLTELSRAPFAVAWAVEGAGHIVLGGANGVQVDGAPHATSSAATVTEDGHVMLARIGPDGRLLLARADGTPLPCTLHADEVRALGAGFVVRSGPRLVQLAVRHGLVVPTLLGQVLPHATRLHDGLAVQNLAGACHLHLLAPGRNDTRRVPDLDGWTIQQAQHVRGVVALTARQAGRTDRFVLRTAPGRLEVRRTTDVDDADVELAALAAPHAVALRVAGRLELFRTRPGDPALRTLEDPVLATGRLVALEGALGLVVEDRLYRLRPTLASAPAPSAAHGRPPTTRAAH